MTDVPISYLALSDGTPVVSASGRRIGTVEHVLQDDDLDFFDGLVVAVGGERRFVDAARIARITAAEVSTTLTDEEADHLPEPDGDGVYAADPNQDSGPGLTAWFGRMFRREHWVQHGDDDSGRSS
jgi:hypothetical protein